MTHAGGSTTDLRHCADIWDLGFSVQPDRRLEITRPNLGQLRHASPTFGLSWAAIGQNLANIRSTSPELYRLWAKVVQLRTNFGQRLSQFCRNRLILVESQLWPNLGNIGSTSVEIGQFWPNQVQIRPTSGNNRPSRSELNRNRPTLAHMGVNLHTQAKLGGIEPLQDDFAREMAAHLESRFSQRASPPPPPAFSRASATRRCMSHKGGL